MDASLRQIAFALVTTALLVAQASAQSSPSNGCDPCGPRQSFVQVPCINVAQAPANGSANGPPNAAPTCTACPPAAPAGCANCAASGGGPCTACGPKGPNPFAPRPVAPSCFDLPTNPPLPPHPPHCAYEASRWPNPAGYCRRLYGTSWDRPPFAPWIESTCGTDDPDFNPPPSPPPDCRRYVVAVDSVFLLRSDPDFSQFEPAFDAVFTGSDSVDLGVGPRVQLLVPCSEKWDLETVYFGTDGWDADSEFALADDTSDVLRFDSQLFSAEVNLRHNTRDWLSLFTGFRYVEFDEELDFGVQLDTVPAVYHFDANNFLYGWQIGADAGLLSLGERFRLMSIIKAGIYGNHADWEQRIVAAGIPMTDGNEFGHTAFVGQIDLLGTLRITEHCALRGGYQVMWLEGVALAMESLVAPPEATGDVFFHGATAGLELRF